MKIFSYLLITCIVGNASLSFSQDFKSRQLSKQDKANGIYKQYDVYYRHSYETLLLFGNRSYRYEFAGMGGGLVSRGTWKIINRQLVLKDSLDKDNLPIQLKCLQDSDTDSELKIQIVRNLNGDVLTDGFVYINNDSTQCLPLTGTSLKEYDVIDSVKVHLENGFKSKWIPVTCKSYKSLLLILQTNFDMYTYYKMRHTRFKIFQSCLKPIPMK